MARRRGIFQKNLPSSEKGKYLRGAAPADRIAKKQQGGGSATNTIYSYQAGVTLLLNQLPRGGHEELRCTLVPENLESDRKDGHYTERCKLSNRNIAIIGEL